MSLGCQTRTGVYLPYLLLSKEGEQLPWRPMSLPWVPDGSPHQDRCKQERRRWPVPGPPRHPNQLNVSLEITRTSHLFGIFSCPPCTCTAETHPQIPELAARLALTASSQGGKVEEIQQTPTMQCRVLTRWTGHPMEHPARLQETTSIRPTSTRHVKDPASTTSPQSTIGPSRLPPPLASSPCQGLTGGCSKAAPLGHARAGIQLPSRTRMTSRIAQSSSGNTTGSQERYELYPAAPMVSHELTLCSTSMASGC